MPRKRKSKKKRKYPKGWPDNVQAALYFNRKNRLERQT